MEKLQRDVRLLKAYAFVVTLLLGILIFAGFGQTNQTEKCKTEKCGSPTFNRSH